MKVTAKGERPAYAVELERGELLTVSSTYESIKYRYDASALKSVRLTIHDGFFVVRFVDRNGKSKEHAFSDAWGFCVN